MKTNFTRICRLAMNGLLFLLTFLYFYLKVDPLIINFKQHPIFLFDKYFFNSYIKYPGGLLDYITLFFKQLYGMKFIGSLMLSLILLIIFLLTREILKNRFNKTVWLEALSYLPVMVLIFLLSDYSFDLRNAIGIIIIEGIFILLVKQRKINPIVRFVFYAALIPFTYYLLGVLSVVLFAVLITIGEFGKNNYKNGSITAILSLVITFFTIYLFILKCPYISSRNLFDSINPKLIGKIDALFLSVIYLWVPLMLVGGLLFCTKGKEISESREENKKGIILVWLSISLLTLASFFAAYQSKEKKLIEIHYLASEKRWEDVLNEAKGMPLDDRKVVFEINRALYHKNLLLDRLFSFNQYFGEHGLILTTYYNSGVLMLCSDLYREMGHIKESTHWAYEAQTKFNYAPNALTRIIENNIIMGNYKVAEKFLTILSGSMLYKEKVKEYRKYIDNEKQVEDNSEFAYLRKLSPKQDFLVNTQNPQVDLYQLIEQNPTNKMAFEYYIAYMLMQNNLARVIPELPRLKTFGYTKIPTYLEQAILLYNVMNKTKKVDLNNYPISQQTMDRFIGYTKIIGQYKGNPKAAQKELSKEYSDTYWYYVYYVSPTTTKREFKTKKSE